MKVVNTNSEIKILLSMEEIKHIANGLGVQPSDLLDDKLSDLVEHIADEIKRYSGQDIFESIPGEYSVGVMAVEDHVMLRIGKQKDMTDLVMEMIDKMQDKPGRFKPVFDLSTQGSVKTEKSTDADKKKQRGCFYELRSVGEAVSLSYYVKQGAIVRFGDKIGIHTSDIVPALNEYAIDYMPGFLSGEVLARITDGRLKRK